MKHNGLIAAIKHRLRLLIPICFSWSFILLGKELLFVSFNKGNLLKSLLVYFVTDFLVFMEYSSSGLLCWYHRNHKEKIQYGGYIPCSIYFVFLYAR